MGTQSSLCMGLLIARQVVASWWDGLVSCPDRRD